MGIKVEIDENELRTLREEILELRAKVKRFELIEDAYETVKLLLQGLCNHPRGGREFSPDTAMNILSRLFGRVTVLSEKSELAKEEQLKELIAFKEAHTPKSYDEARKAV